MQRLWQGLWPKLGRRLGCQRVRRARFTTVAALLPGLAALTACSPEMNWRQVRLDATPMQALMPCKPDREVRPLTIAGAAVQVQMRSCEAGGVTWALAHADVRDAALVGPALVFLKTSAGVKLGAAQVESAALQVPGMTPNAESARLSINGQRPDRSPVRQVLAVFSHGTSVFEAVAIGPRLPPEALESFFESVRIDAGAKPHSDR
jgi:hypothetical protein